MKISNFIIITLAVLAWSCGDDDKCITGGGGIVTEEIPSDDFVAIQVEGSFNVNIIQDANQRVEATGDANVVEELIVEVQSGTLLVRLPQGCFSDFRLEVDIYTHVLEAVGGAGSGNIEIGAFADLENVLIASAGSGNLTSSGTLELAGNMEIGSTGSGNVSLDLVAQELTVIQTGSGTIALGGEVLLQNVTKSGSGDYLAFDLSSDNCAITSSGSGNSEVTVEEGLTVMSIGSGNISYRGNPEIDENVTGSGRVIDAN